MLTSIIRLMMKWLREHLSGIVEKVLASLLVAGLLYALTFVPKVGPTLSMTIAIPVWFLVPVPLAAGLLTLLFRRRAANSRAAHALSFEKIVNKLDRERTAKKIGEIRFDYLPDTPASHGWTIGLDQGTPELPSFSAVPDAPVPGSIAIQAHASYFMDYAVDPMARSLIVWVLPCGIPGTLRFTRRFEWNRETEQNRKSSGWRKKSGAAAICSSTTRSGSSLAQATS